MGVKGLFQFLKRFSKRISIREIVKDKSVGIDIFGFIHQSKGDFFTLQNNILPFIKYASAVHCVFDGEPSPDKKIELKELAEKRKEILSSISQIEKFLKYPFHHLKAEDRYIINQYLNQLKRQIWQPSPDYIDAVMKWLESKGCITYQATGEADSLLIELEKDMSISIIITSDSDLLVLGSKSIFRQKNSLEGELFDIDYICQQIDFTKKQWIDFMYLCKNMKHLDIHLAYSLIAVYKDLEYVIQKSYILYDDYLIKELNVCGAGT
jgi:hypothetical protein